MAIKLGTYDENGALISSAMPGDKFKTEMESALDKRGDVMVDGATITLGRDPENDMDAMTKKYLDGFISYLNNSPLTEKRDSDGKYIFSSMMEDSEYNKKPLFTEPFQLVSKGVSNNVYGQYDGFELDLNLSNSILGHSSSERHISISIEVEIPVWDELSSYTGSTSFACMCWFYLKKDGRVIKQTDVRTISRHNQMVNFAGTFDVARYPISGTKFDPGIYTLGMYYQKLDGASNIYTLTINPLVTIQEQAVLRNIIEY